MKRLVLILFFILSLSKANAEDKCSDNFKDNTSESEQEASLSERSKGRFYSNDPRFIEASLKDLEKLVQYVGKRKEYNQYAEFLDLIHFMQEGSVKSQEFFKKFAQGILDKERADSYYDFHEFRKGALKPDGFFMRKFKILEGKDLLKKGGNPKETGDIDKNREIELSVLNYYEANKDALIYSVENGDYNNYKPIEKDQLNLIGHILWKFQAEDVASFLKSFYEKKWNMGSYYYALHLAEDHFNQGKRSVAQIADIFQEVSHRMILASQSKDMNERSYYYDKLLKIYILNIYFNNQASVHFRDKFNKIKKVSSQNQIQVDSIRSQMEHYEKNSIASLIRYLTFTKHSESEEIIRRSYGLVSNSRLEEMNNSESKGKFTDGDAGKFKDKTQNTSQGRTKNKKVPVKKANNVTNKSVLELTRIVKEVSKELVFRVVNEVEKIPELTFIRKNVVMPEKEVYQIIREFQKLSDQYKTTDPSFLFVNQSNALNRVLEDMEFFAGKVDAKNNLGSSSTLPFPSKQKFNQNYSAFVSNHILKKSRSMTLDKLTKLNQSLKNPNSFGRNFEIKNSNSKDESRVIKKYMKFKPVIESLTSPSGRSESAWDALAENIINLERSERYYFFKEAQYEMTVYSGVPKRVLRSVESLEKEVLSIYEEYARALIVELKKEKEREKDPGVTKPWFLDARNEFGKYVQMGWKANLKSSKELTKMLYKKTIVGSYYYALGVAEDYLKDKKSGTTNEPLKVFEEVERMIFEKLVKEKRSRRKAYLTDKWIKIILLKAYFYHEGFLKERKMESSPKDSEMGHVYSIKFREYLAGVQSTLMYYLAFSKYSGVEDVFKEKYKIGDKGSYLDYSDIKDISTSSPRKISE